MQRQEEDKNKSETSKLSTAVQLTLSEKTGKTLYNLFTTYDTAYYKPYYDRRNTPYTLKKSPGGSISYNFNFPIFRIPSKKSAGNIKFIVLDTKAINSGANGSILPILTTLTLDEENKTVKATTKPHRCVKKSLYNASHASEFFAHEASMTHLLAPYMHMKPPLVFGEIIGQHLYFNESGISLLRMKQFNANEYSDLFEITDNDKNQMDIRSLFNIALSITDGVATLHQQGYIHRDIKPENILVNLRKQKARLIDFDYAKKADKPDTTCVGTLSFADPYVIEQFVQLAISATNPVNIYDESSDNYALGKTLIELFARFIELPAKDTLVQKISSLLELLTHKNPALRCSLQDFTEQLKDIAQPYLDNTEDHTSKTKAVLDEEAIKLIREETEKRLNGILTPLIHVSLFKPRLFGVKSLSVQEEPENIKTIKKAM